MTSEIIERIKELKAAKNNFHIEELTGMSEMLAAVEREIDGDKIYPKDIWPDLTPTELEKIHDFCVTQLGFPLDRFSANMFRRAFDIQKQKLSEIKETLE